MSLKSEPTSREGRNYQVIPKPGATKLAIFFSGTDRDNGRFDWWGSGRSQDAHQIFVSNGRNRWYQEGVPGLGTSIDETVRTFQRWADHLKVGQRIFTFGVSMGGFGATLYGARLGAQILAFGFDSELEFPGSRSAKRIPPSTKRACTDLALEMEASAGASLLHYAGEYDAYDLVGAMHMKRAKATTVKTLRGVGHGGAPFIDKKYGLSRFVSNFLLGEPRPEFDEEGDAINQPHIVRAYLNVYRAFASNDWEETLRLATILLASAPTFEPAYALAGHSLFKLKRYQEAISNLSIAVALCPHFSQPRFKLSQALLKIKDYQRALHSFRVYKVMVPTSTTAETNISFVLTKMNALKSNRPSKDGAAAFS